MSDMGRREFIEFHAIIIQPISSRVMVSNKF